MSRLLKPEEHIRISLKRDKAEREYQHWDKEYKRTASDLQKYWEIIYRATSEYIKFTAAGYERMLNVKSHEIAGNKVTITGDSVEIAFPNTCIIRNNVTIEYPLTDDCDLLSWTYERPGFSRVYDTSDWMAFLFKGLRCKDIKKIE